MEFFTDIDNKLIGYSFEEMEITKAGRNLDLMLTGLTEDFKEFKLVTISFSSVSFSTLTETAQEMWAKEPIGCEPKLKSGSLLNIKTDYITDSVILNTITEIILSNESGILLTLELPLDDEISITFQENELIIFSLEQLIYREQITNIA